MAFEPCLSKAWLQAAVDIGVLDSVASSRIALHRHPERGAHDWDVINAILDEALTCHVGFVEHGEPIVVPTLCVRMGRRLVLHGSAASRMLKRLRSGGLACIAATLTDGIVLARSAIHHSVNYRSVIAFGEGLEITDPSEKLACLKALTERVAQGRWADVRKPTAQELRSTMVVAIHIIEASAKVRLGPPVDNEEDYTLPVWAGVIPLSFTRQEAVPDPRLKVGIDLPDYV